jgi:hypothetical protein
MLADHVTSRFPSVGVTKIKQVLAYKCKESASSFRVQNVRSYGSVYSVIRVILLFRIAPFQ